MSYNSSGPQDADAPRTAVRGRDRPSFGHSERGQAFSSSLVNARYGRASTVLTSNKGFEHWAVILHEEVMAAALLDRCHIVNIRGNRFRMRRQLELSKTIHPTAARAADAERPQEAGES